MSISAVLLILGFNCSMIKNDSTLQMKDLLKSISITMIEIADSNYSDINIKSKWFGFNGASNDEIIRTENRLKISLPQDYKDFLMISNGFHSFSTIDPTFFPIEKVDYLRNIDPELIRIWRGTETERIGIELEKSIIIAGIDEEQYFLLIPPDTDSNKWKYWKFASWIPGEHEFVDLVDYLKNSLEFLNDLKNDK